MKGKVEGTKAKGRRMALSCVAAGEEGKGNKKNEHRMLNRIGFSGY